MNGFQDRDSVHQVVFRWDGNHGRQGTGMNAVAHSCPAERAGELGRELGPLLWVSGAAAARPSVVRTLSRDGDVMLVQRWPTTDRGGRPSTVSHVLVGDPEILNTWQCLGLAYRGWGRPEKAEQALGKEPKIDCADLDDLARRRLPDMLELLPTVKHALTLVTAELLRDPAQRVSLRLEEQTPHGWPDRDGVPLVYLGLYLLFGRWLRQEWTFATYDTVDTHPLRLTSVPRWEPDTGGSGPLARVMGRPPAQPRFEHQAAAELVKYLLAHPQASAGVPHLVDELADGAALDWERRRARLRDILDTDRPTSRRTAAPAPRPAGGGPAPDWERGRDRDRDLDPDRHPAQERYGRQERSADREQERYGGGESVRDREQERYGRQEPGGDQGRHGRQEPGGDQGRYGVEGRAREQEQARATFGPELRPEPASAPPSRPWQPPAHGSTQGPTQGPAQGPAYEPGYEQGYEPGYEPGHEPGYKPAYEPLPGGPLGSAPGGGLPAADPGVRATLQAELRDRRRGDIRRRGLLKAQLSEQSDEFLLGELRFGQLPQDALDLVLNELGKSGRTAARDPQMQHALCAEVLGRDLYLTPQEHSGEFASRTAMVDRAAVLFRWAVAPLARNERYLSQLREFLYRMSRDPHPTTGNWLWQTIVDAPDDQVPDLPPTLWRQILKDAISRSSRPPAAPPEPRSAPPPMAALTRPAAPESSALTDQQPSFTDWLTEQLNNTGCLIGSVVVLFIVVPIIVIVMISL
ncbi:hypothetical protein AQI88_14465 [Streptomyces cellostaticus]|uniref:Uncharacterized protein n=1 Tax=Streptomyces cellostaticus TaxID=67285 RepID=A0A124HCY1_9ACTN|nr:hypothetical protein [Streptomyces cellostaticus]KUM95827.1 hypothetical protein AQI88_14465 [Streptomyces cellostaticus]GHI02553.1 hypothetical protein Scel_08740 [Streptomyces cellostaticus]